MAESGEFSEWLKHLAIAGLCAAILAINIWLAWGSCNWSLVPRSGTLIVATGILLESWLVLTTARSDDMPFYGSQSSHTAIQVAVVIVCVGTLIQGYGDFVRHLLPQCQG